MKTNVVNISSVYSLEGDATLSCFAYDTFHDDGKVRKKPAIIVVPGGGYGMVSKREGEPIAAYFMGLGYSAFVLDYSVAPICYPAQLLQLSASVDYVNSHAKEYNVDTKKIYVVGFSAGGHLVGNFATDYVNVNKKFGKKWNLNATAVALSYPVIGHEYGHVDSHDNLLAKYTQEEKQELYKSVDLDNAVTAKTLPSFVWTTQQDTCVPPINAFRYVEACLTNNVRCEFHMFPDGWHGMSTCDMLTNYVDKRFMKKNHNWLELCAEFFATC